MDVKKEIEENINEENIIKILKHYNCNPVVNITEYIIFPSVCHNKISSHKLYYYKSSKSFFCYSNCGSMSIFDLIMEIENTNFRNALKILCEILNVEFSQGFYIPDEDDTFLTQIQKKKDEELELEKQKQFFIDEQERTLRIELTPINKRILQYFSSDLSYCRWLYEDYEEFALRQFEIKSYIIDGGIIIPHFDIDNNLVGIRVRNFGNKEKFFGKYTPLYLDMTMYKHSLSYNLYGLNLNKHTIKNSKRCVIVESEKAVIKAKQWFKNFSIVIGVCGSNISYWQINTLAKLGVKEICFCWDKDYRDETEKEKWRTKVLKIYNKAIKFIERKEFDIRLTIIDYDTVENNIEYKSNPFDLNTPNVYKQLFKNRIAYENV